MKKLIYLSIASLILPFTVSTEAQASSMNDEEFQRFICPYLEYETDHEKTVDELIIPQIGSLIDSDQEDFLKDVKKSEVDINDFCSQDFSDDD